MINIISTEACTTKVSGPGKVFRNLLKGLAKINAPFGVNQPIHSTSQVYIHNDRRALLNMPTAINAIVGPNIFLDPSEIPAGVSLKHCLFLQPCEWAREGWLELGFDQCPIKVWPVGIDTEKFYPGAHERNEILVMYKDWSSPPRLGDPQPILAELEAHHLKFNLLVYPNYVESDYLRLLHRARLVVWYGRPETQGIGLLEALACDVPMIVFDIPRLPEGHNQNGQLANLPISTAPYFNDACGVKIESVDQLGKALDYVLDDLSRFSPRNYIEQNLSLEKQASALVALWDYWQTQEPGILTSPSYANPSNLETRTWHAWEPGGHWEQTARRMYKRVKYSIPQNIRVPIKRLALRAIGRN